MLHKPNKYGPRFWTRRKFLAAGGGVALWSWWGRAGAGGEDKTKEELARIAAAIPKAAWVRPRRPRRLLIFERNVNYGGHASIRTATAAFAMMGEKTGAFAVTATNDPEVFRRDSLSAYDGVFFNNNVGNLFTEPDLRESLAEFIFSGGGMMGVHGTTVAFTVWPGAKEDWPEFGLMIGARGANHRENTERVVMKIEEPGHPLMRAFAGTHFEYRDEFFRVHEPYSRRRLRVLLSMDLSRMEPSQGPAYGQVLRADQDYAVAWARQYGRGRSFYCTIAHNPYVFWEPVLLSFYLAAAQFILGDLAAPVTPSARLTPGVRALEKLGWRLGLAGAHEATLFGAMETAEAAGLLHVSAGMGQRVDGAANKPLGPDLSSEERRQIRFKHDATGVRLLTCHVPEAPATEAECRSLFEFARRMGFELVVAPATVTRERLAVAERCARQSEMKLALRPVTRQPLAEAERFCRQTGAEVGVWWDDSLGRLCGVTPKQAVRRLRKRLFGVESSLEANRAGEMLRALAAEGVRPVMVALPAGAELGRLCRVCEAVALDLAG